IEKGATDILDRIGRMGGTLAASETGVIQREIQESAYRSQLAIDSGEAAVVGVNCFTEKESGVKVQNSKDDSRPIFQIDPEIEKHQIDRVRQLRARRSPAEWSASLARVTEAARNGSNLVPAIVAAVEARATLGEVA